MIHLNFFLDWITKAGWWLVVYMFIFYAMFITTMAAKAAWPTLPLLSKVWCSVYALIGWLMDVFFNVVIFTALLLILAFLVLIITWNKTWATELFWVAIPRELLFTSRLNRYELGTGWLAYFAIQFCRILNPFQIGGHCIKVEGDQ